MRKTSHLKKKFSIKRGENSRVAKEKGRGVGGKKQGGVLVTPLGLDVTSIRSAILTLKPL